MSSNNTGTRQHNCTKLLKEIYRRGYRTEAITFITFQCFETERLTDLALQSSAANI